jgi:tetratricopeptide (TPR) repeat protein
MKRSALLLDEVKRGEFAQPHVVDNAYAIVPSPVYPYNRRRAPASAMHCSLNDLIRWAQVHLNRGQLDGRRILKASTYDEMWKAAGPAFAHIGLGWFLWHRAADAVVGHNGSDTGFVADFELIPARGIAVIVMCNLDHGPYRAIVSAALDAALGKASTAVIKPSLAKVIYETVAAQGVDAAVARYRQIRKEQQDTYQFSEWVLNDLGYKLALSGELDAAIRLLRLNVEEYPASANVYDSLGQACYSAGDRACALENFRKALEKNPKNGKAAEMVRALGARSANH